MEYSKVQTNKDGVSVLVQTPNSSNKHSHYTNVKVTVCTVLSDKEILELYESEATESEKIAYARDWIKRKESFAISNVTDKKLNIRNGDIVIYEDYKASLLPTKQD